MDWEFGNYRLKRAERLLIGPNGPVELSARSFDILNALLGLAVEENTMQVHISALRRALSPSMIITVHGRG
jgi:adenylate cyclase